MIKSTIPILHGILNSVLTISINSPNIRRRSYKSISASFTLNILPLIISSRIKRINQNRLLILIDRTNMILRYNLNSSIILIIGSKTKQLFLITHRSQIRNQINTLVSRINDSTANNVSRWWKHSNNRTSNRFNPALKHTGNTTNSAFEPSLKTLPALTLHRCIEILGIQTSHEGSLRIFRRKQQRTNQRHERYGYYFII